MKQILLIATCIFILAACKKEKSKDPETPETPVTPVTPTGNLYGKVYQYNQFGTIYNNGLNTTTVSIEGQQTYTTVTDTSGRFILSGIPSGTYTLIFKKPGSGLIKLEGIYFNVGDTTTYKADIADIPVFTIGSAYLKDTTWFANTLGGIYYDATTNSTNKKASIVAIIGKSTKIDIADPSSYLNYAVGSIADTVNFNRFFSYSLLKNSYLFKKDSILYMKIYPVATKGSYYLHNFNTPICTAYGTPYPTIFSLTLN